MNCRKEKKVDQRYLILSDIHGNLSALEAVLSDCAGESFDGIILLGDCIDYGMRSNEVIDRLLGLFEDNWKDRVIVNIWGNHEKLLIDRDLERLSSDRGRVMAEYTASHLNERSKQYVREQMNREGIQDFELNGHKCLAVHGSLADHYWKAVSPEDVHGDYSEYDFVFSGHSHYSQCFTIFYQADAPEMRNKKAVMFINPGSVGQPRNQNPCAQYAVLSMPEKRVELRAVPYDVPYEQSLYPDEIDSFYKTRLTNGI